ncbi:piggyBac transposable element-derived protein 4 [Trichonephila clavipes]|nr:piggyBac transposable element-derived protein 4 [Trichonephila clavipes]
MENNICNSMILTSRRRHFYLVGQSKHKVGACGVNNQASAVLAERSSDEEFSSSQSESDDDCLDSARDWCQIDVTSPLPSHPKFPFTGNPGIKGSKMEKYEQGRDEKIYLSAAPTRRSTKTLEKWFWSKRPILSTPFFVKVMKSDYIWNSLIYTGKGTAFNENYNDYGLSTKSVLTLIHELKEKGYCLSTDNFYTSPELVELLIDSKTDICGTLRPNRKVLPVSLKSSTLKKGEIIAFPKRKLWFQQDGATCYTARATIDLLKETFGDRLISRFRPVNWPPRSCDLTLLDYFLWGYVKSLIYADKPQTLGHLEDNIRCVIADIRRQMLEKVIENWTSSLDYIRASLGSHMPEIIFKM